MSRKSQEHFDAHFSGVAQLKDTQVALRSWLLKFLRECPSVNETRIASFLVTSAQASNYAFHSPATVKFELGISDDSYQRATKYFLKTSFYTMTRKERRQLTKRKAMVFGCSTFLNIGIFPRNT